MGGEWLRDENAIRSCAARTHYADGATAWKANRPKKAYAEFLEAMRFVPNYRDAGTRADAAYEKGLCTPPDWRIACCYVGKGHRRRGVATAALAGALDLIAGLGGGTVEGYPEDVGSVPAGFLFNGALSTYEKLGFIRDRKIGKHRWVVTRVVEPRS